MYIYICRHICIHIHTYLFIFVVIFPSLLRPIRLSLLPWLRRADGRASGLAQLQSEARPGSSQGAIIVTVGSNIDVDIDTLTDEDVDIDTAKERDTQ